MKNLFGFLIVIFIISNCVLKAQWVSANWPFSGYTNCLSVSDSNIFAGTNGDGIYASTDDGINWTAYSNGLPNLTIVTSLAICPLNKTGNSNLFAGTNTGIYLSKNNGLNWTPFNNGLTNSEVLSLVVSDTNIFAGTNGKGVFLSTNNGSSWSEVNNGLLNNYSTNVYSLLVTPFGADSSYALFAGTSRGVFRSTDNGANWTDENVGLSYYPAVNSLVSSGKYLFAGTFAGVFLSTNYGSTWTAVNNGLNNSVVFSLAISADGKDLFAGTLHNGVFLSKDNGENWSAINDGLANLTIYSLFVNSEGTSTTKIFAGTYSNVYHRSISDLITDVKKENNNFPASYSLKQNYPNPFNPTTSISYQLASPSTSRSGLQAYSHVTIKVYDLLGREIATLVNEIKPAGNYSVKFDGSKLTSGIYFYRMESGTYSQTKKLLLLK
jgi:photosystem II stability/assembly factor-like uncharacterized protein